MAETEPQDSPTPAVSRETVRATPPAPVLSVINQKGGVGKTTTTVSLAAALSHRGYRVLLVDLDPQGNATTALGIDRYTDDIPLSSEMLFSEEGTRPSPLAPTAPGRPYLLAGEVALVQADLRLVQRETDRERLLHERIQPYRDEFDLILIDAPPALGALALNILIASTHLIVPIQCEYLALEGLTMLFDTIEDLRERHGVPMQVLGCLVTMTDLRTNLSQQVVADLREHLGDLMFDTMAPRTVRLSECPSHGQTIFEYDRWGAGARCYDAVARELLTRLSLEHTKST